MSRRVNIVFLALGAFIAGVAPYAVRAQSGDALARAEKTCLDNGVGPRTVAFDTCVSRAADALAHGEPQAAAAEAQRLSDARETCMSYDLDPMTLGYHQCISSETRKHHIAALPDDGRYRSQ